MDNQHVRALEYAGRAGDISQPWQADFGGRIVRGQGNTWLLTIAKREDDMPVNLRILQLSMSGEGEV